MVSNKGENWTEPHNHPNFLLWGSFEIMGSLRNHRDFPERAEYQSLYRSRQNFHGREKREGRGKEQALDSSITALSKHWLSTKFNEKSLFLANSRRLRQWLSRKSIYLNTCQVLYKQADIQTSIQSVDTSLDTLSFQQRPWQGHSGAVPRWYSRSHWEGNLQP